MDFDLDSDPNLFSTFPFNFRCLSAKAQTKPAINDDVKKSPKPRNAPAAENHSFVHNLFRGSLETSQVFPFPMYLNQEQLEYVGAFVDPVTKYFSEVHDAAKYDLQEKLDPETLDHLWELGAFGLMVPQEYGGLELNNTQFGRLAEIVGMNDLGTGVTMGAHQSIGYKVSKMDYEIIF